MSESAPFVFRYEDYFPQAVYELMCNLRVNDPVAIYKATQTRQPRKEFMPPDRKLLLLSADHLGRGATGLGDDPLRLANRWEYIARLVRVLLGGAFDGVMGTPDVLEELCLVQQIVRENGGPAFLDQKVFVGCVNRGGIEGATFEMDDAFTAFSVERAKHLRCDALKVSLRIDLASADTAKTLERCSRLVAACNDAQMALFIECTPVERDASGNYAPRLGVEAFAKATCIASALGETSTRTWLRMPNFEGLAEALKATSLPCVLQGGSPRSDAPALLREVEAAMRVSGQVRGVMMGRPILYPGDDDPLAVAAGVEAIVRRGAESSVIIEKLDQVRGARFDVLTSLIAEGLRFEGGTQTASYMS